MMELTHFLYYSLVTRTRAHYSNLNIKHITYVCPKHNMRKNMHGYTFQTNLQEHKMCNKRRFGIVIHVQTYVQSITLGPDQKLKKMVIFANFVSTHTSNVVKTLNLEICGLRYIGAESVVHDILTTSRMTGLVPRPHPPESVVHDILTTSRTTGLVPNLRKSCSFWSVHDCHAFSASHWLWGYAFMSNRCYTTILRGKTDDL